MTAQENPVWFITGCSSGFGRALAQLALGKGRRVVVTALNSDEIKDIVADYGEQALALNLDVTDPAQIEAAVKKAESVFGSIDILVNSAGYGYLGAVEESEEKEIRALFETNFFGLSALTRAILPGMRQRRRGGIVNFSSTAGLTGFPGAGYYSATKFAVEGLSESLAKEVEPLGIKIVVVEPGPSRTNWAAALKKSPHQISDYAATAHARMKQIAGLDGSQPGDPARAAEAIFAAAESAAPSFRLLLGKSAVATMRMKIDQLQHDLDDGENTALTADFPQP